MASLLVDDCHGFICFWHDCKEWVISWYVTALLDFICGIWALYEFIHVFVSIHKIKKANSLPTLNIYHGTDNNNNNNTKNDSNNMDDYESIFLLILLHIPLNL